VSDKRLTSPDIPIGGPAAQLSFRHRYNLEISSNPATAYDGGVLEISIGGGAFTDIIAAGGAWVANGYTSTVSPSFSNPLGGRGAWSGSSGVFVTTIVKLPASAAGQNVQLRWRLGTDSSVTPPDGGWHVDTISIIEPSCCLAICNVPFADHDGDGDVDQTDFSAWQLCAGPFSPGPCSCFDRNGNNVLDNVDFDAFLLCMTASDIPANPTCGQ
jgi:hypothetical protein